MPWKVEPVPESRIAHKPPSGPCSGTSSATSACPRTQGKVERLNVTPEREVWPAARRDLVAHFEADLERSRPIDNAEPAPGALR